MSERSREQLEALPHQDREIALQQLAQTLTNQLSDQPDQEHYFAKVEEIIADLRALDHDLWLHDYDGQKTQVWGWDYMKPTQAGHLQITFTWTGKVQVRWRE